jgi:hypothetical protein
LALLDRFPHAPGAVGALQALLADMCPNPQSLTWLVDEFVNRIGKWHGSKELRGVLCWHCKPRDGIEANSTIPGYRPVDGEMRSLERHAQIKAAGAAIEGPGAKLVTDLANRKSLGPGNPTVG